eukprot:COSAG02_NODE_4330_length_5495_cov_21.736471_4_plen_89_part_00
MLRAEKSDRIAPAHAVSFLLCVYTRGAVFIRMDSEEFRDPERSQPLSSSTSTGAGEQQPQRGPDNDSEWEAAVEKDRRSVTSFEQAFK